MSRGIATVSDAAQNLRLDLVTMLFEVPEYATLTLREVAWAFAGALEDAHRAEVAMNTVTPRPDLRVME